MGGGQISVWEDSTLVYPNGSGVMSASNVVFRNCRFEPHRGMQFYKAEYGAAARPNVLIDSTLPVASAQSPVAWVRGKAQPRPSVFSLTYHNKDSAGNPAVLYDSMRVSRSSPIPGNCPKARSGPTIHGIFSEHCQMARWTTGTRPECGSSTKRLAKEISSIEWPCRAAARPSGPAVLVPQSVQP